MEMVRDIKRKQDPERERKYNPEKERAEEAKARERYKDECQRTDDGTEGRERV